MSTNDPARPVFHLTLRAHIKPGMEPKVVGTPPAVEVTAGPQQAGPFSVSPINSWMVGVVAGDVARTALYLSSRDGRPVRILRVDPGGADFTVSVRPLEGGSQYQLQLATNPALKPGSYKQTVRIVADSKDEDAVTEISLQASVLPRVFVAPSEIPDLKISRSQSATARMPQIQIRKLRGGNISILKASSSLPFIKPIINSEGGVSSTQIIWLTIDKSKLPATGAFAGSVTLHTDDPEFETVEIRITGTVE